jgi:hypothetical protein
MLPHLRAREEGSEPQRRRSVMAVQEIFCGGENSLAHAADLAAHALRRRHPSNVRASSKGDLTGEGVRRVAIGRQRCVMGSTEANTGPRVGVLVNVTRFTLLLARGPASGRQDARTRDDVTGPHGGENLRQRPRRIGDVDHQRRLSQVRRLARQALRFMRARARTAPGAS